MVKWPIKTAKQPPKPVILIKGCSVSNLEGLTENYAQVSDIALSASVSAPRILEVFEAFVRNQIAEEDFFLFIEIPTNYDVEKEFEGDQLHRDIYYLDGLNQGQVLQFLESTDFQILLHDGMSFVGFGTRFSQSELGLYAYNVMTGYAAEGLDELVDLFESFGIGRLPELVSAWDFISKKNPGVSTTFSIDGQTAYDVVEKLKQFGLYLYERREE